MIIYIYKITNTITSKCYIGKTNNIKRRWQEHKSKNIKTDSKLGRAFIKYGIDSFQFEVLFCITSWNDVEDIERHFVDAFDSYYNGYNSTIGGGGSTRYIPDDDYKFKSGSSARGIPKSIEHKIKISKSNLGKHNHYKEFNPRFDNTIYTFINTKTDETFVGVRYDFIKKYNLSNGNVSSLINGKITHYKKWIVKNPDMHIQLE